MAKKKVNETIKYSGNSEFDKPYSKEDIKLKEKGEVYTIKKDWVMPGSMGTLLAGGTFEECVNGWFWPVSKTGFRCWFRISKSVLDGIKENENIQL